MTHTTSKTAVRRLAAARLISITGGAASYTALMFTVYQLTHSPTWLSATLLLTFGVSGFVAPLAGVIGDRFDRRRVMIVSDLLGVGCFRSFKPAIHFGAKCFFRAIQLRAHARVLRALAREQPDQRRLARAHAAASKPGHAAKDFLHGRRCRAEVFSRHPRRRSISCWGV